VPPRVPRSDEWLGNRGCAVHVIVIGAGEVGYHVAERLSREQHDVVVVDVAAARLEHVESHLDVAVLQGSGASPAVLDQAGVAKADLLMAVTNVDEVNLVCCMAAQGKADLIKVARVSNPDFFTDGGRLDHERFGVHVMINPERELAFETFRLLQSTVATDVAEFAGGAVQLIGVRVAPGAPIAGKRLVDIAAEVGSLPMLTAGIDRDGRMTVPRGGSIVQGGDLLYIVAATEAIPRALALCGHEHAVLRRVMISGGSREAFYLAQLLAQHRVHATVVVRERERAQEFAEKLDRALVLNADPTQVELLELEGVGGVDAFVALTDEDETNILSSLAAKHAGAKQVVTLVNRMDYLPLLRRIGLESVVSPRLSAANAILRYVRRGNVIRVATLKESEAEVISFHVSPASPLVGRPLADVNFPEDAIVATIVRGRQVVVPRGRDALQADDTAVVFALPDAVKPVVALFAR